MSHTEAITSNAAESAQVPKEAPAVNYAEAKKDVPNESAESREANTLIFTVEKARNIFLERGLKGNISLTRSCLLFYRSVAVDVDGPKEKAKGMNTKTVELPPTYYEKCALMCVNRCIRSLTRRAAAYKDKPYAEDLALSNTIYTAFPIFDCLSLSVTCTATVRTLIDSLETSKEAAKEVTETHDDDHLWLCCCA